MIGSWGRGKHLLLGGTQKRLWGHRKVLFLELDVAYADVHFERILQATHVCILDSYECITFYYKK